VFIYQTNGVILPKDGDIQYFCLYQQPVLHCLLFTPSHCLQIYILRYLCIHQSTSSLRWKSTLSPGTYWTASIRNEYNMQHYLHLYLVLLLPLLHVDVVSRYTPSYRRRSSVKYETVPQINASLLFGGYRENSQGQRNCLRGVNNSPPPTSVEVRQG
jgi:hypothetical protein